MVRGMQHEEYLAHALLVQTSNDLVHARTSYSVQARPSILYTCVLRKDVAETIER